MTEELEIEKYKKKIIRLKRDKNFLEIEKKRLIKELELERLRNKFLIKRVNTFQLLETYLIERAKVLKKLSNKEFKFAVLELEKLSNALEEEKQMLYNEVEEDERENNERTCNEIKRDTKRTRYITNRI